MISVDNTWFAVLSNHFFLKSQDFLSRRRQAIETNLNGNIVFSQHRFFPSNMFSLYLSTVSQMLHESCWIFDASVLSGYMPVQIVLGCSWVPTFQFEACPDTHGYHEAAAAAAGAEVLPSGRGKGASSTQARATKATPNITCHVNDTDNSVGMTVTREHCHTAATVTGECPACRALLTLTIAIFAQQQHPQLCQDVWI